MTWDVQWKPSKFIFNIRSEHRSLFNENKWILKPSSTDHLRQSTVTVTYTDGSANILNIDRLYNIV